jgi:hypothetical protein
MNLFDEYPDLLNRIAEDMDENLSTEEKMETLRDEFTDMAEFAVRENLPRDGTINEQLVIEDIAKQWIQSNINMTFTQQFESIFFNQ